MAVTYGANVTPAATLLRPARPTIEDGTQFARYLDVAAEGAFRAMLGRRVEPIVAEAFLETGHDLSYEHVTMAEHDGPVVAMASGFTAEEHNAASDEPLARAAGIRAWRISAISTVARGLFRFLETVPDGDFYLMAVAVDPEQRGLGIGSELIAHMEQRARDAGATRIVLDVAERNEGGRRLYERLGMTVEATSPRVLFLPRSRALRMVRTL